MNLTDKLRENYPPGVPYTVPETNHTLPQILFDTAKRYPNRVAIDFLGASITYSQLARRVRQTARLLTQSGVRKGDRVGITLPNCPQHIVAAYGALTIGAIVVETNPLSPKTELSRQLREAGCEVLITWENSLSSIDLELVAPRHVFTVDLTKALPLGPRLLINLPVAAAKRKKAQMSAKTPSWTRDFDSSVANTVPWRGDIAANVDDIALFLHTGGTTGVPKASMLTHRSIAANIMQSKAWVPALHEGAEVFYVILPLFHAYGFTVAIGAGIELGATLALFPKFDVAMVLDAQKRLPCTFFIGVAPMFSRLLTAVEKDGGDLSSIKFTLSGAMPLSTELAQAWEKATNGYMIEGYGMTECSPIISGSPLSSARRAGTLGLPFPSTEVRIADPENLDNDVADGEVGELLVRGPQVFKGYWNNPEETEIAFHEGWLRTGDLVQVKDGFIVMADRKKEMIISGGFNIFPSQVEDAVRDMPGVNDVAVVGIPEAQRGEEVVAALILEAGATVTLEDVRRWAEKSLAHYALPRRIVIMQELPRSPIGKVMRRKVRDYLQDAGIKLDTSSLDLREQIREGREQLRESAEAATAELRALSERVEGQTKEAAERLRQLAEQAKTGGVFNPTDTPETKDRRGER
ncbi:MAG: AMP-binding protein [Actinomycetaceae bacterium]|nr:AMP-binding protein [Actinomycetaceae bacterium]